MEYRLSEQQQCDHIIFSFVMYRIFTYTPKKEFQGKCSALLFLSVSVPTEKIISSVNSDLYEYVLFLKFALKLWVKKIPSPHTVEVSKMSSRLYIYLH